MPELRRFAPDVPIVLVGTKLGKYQNGFKFYRTLQYSSPLRSESESLCPYALLYMYRSSR